MHYRTGALVMPRVQSLDPCGLLPSSATWLTLGNERATRIDIDEAWENADIQQPRCPTPRALAELRN